MYIYYSWPGRRTWTPLELDQQAAPTKREPTVAEVTKAILSREQTPQVSGWCYGLHLVDAQTGASFNQLDQGVPLNTCLRAKWVRVKPRDYQYCQACDDLFCPPRTLEEVREREAIRHIEKQERLSWRHHEEQKRQQKRRERFQKREGRTTRCKRCGELGHVEVNCQMIRTARPTGIPRAHLERTGESVAAGGRTQLQGEDGAYFRQRNQPEYMPASVPRAPAQPTARTDCPHVNRVPADYLLTLECCGATLCKECFHAYLDRWCQCH